MMATRIVCTCDEAEQEGMYSDCEIHVHCDEKCGALQEHVTLKEIKATMIHYREHPWLGGCSHGE